MKRTLLTLLSGCAIMMAQSPIIFMPSPGNNDGSDQGSLTGGKDALVSDGASATNYGDHSLICAMPISTCNNTNVTSYVQFDLSTLPATVDSVFFAGWTWDQGSYCYSNCNNNWEFWYVGQSWNEMEITWNTKPALDSAFAGPFNRDWTDTAHFQKFDITEAYRNWKSGTVPNYGLAIVGIDGSCNNASVNFGVYSSDDTTAGGSMRAHLIVYSPSVGLNEPVGNITSSCFPNPAKDLFTIQYQQKTSGASTLSVMDLTGRVVLVQHNLQQSGAVAQVVELGELPSGVYHWNLNTPDGQVAGKLVKE